MPDMFDSAMCIEAAGSPATSGAVVSPRPGMTTVSCCGYGMATGSLPLPTTAIIGAVVPDTWKASVSSAPEGVGRAVVRTRRRRIVSPVADHDERDERQDDDDRDAGQDVAAAPLGLSVRTRRPNGSTIGTLAAHRYSPAFSM